MLGKAAQQVAALVYHLYALTEEEVAIVEEAAARNWSSLCA